MSMERHCDPVTMDHIIQLRKELRETQRQRDNAVDRCVALDKIVWDLRSKLMFLPEGKPNDDDERNC